MDELKIEDLENKEEEVDDYVPEDPNAPVDDFEESDIAAEMVGDSTYVSDEELAARNGNLDGFYVEDVDSSDFN